MINLSSCNGFIISTISEFRHIIETYIFTKGDSGVTRNGNLWQIHFRLIKGKLTCTSNVVHLSDHIRSELGLPPLPRARYSPPKYHFPQETPLTRLRPRSPLLHPEPSLGALHPSILSTFSGILCPARYRFCTSRTSLPHNAKYIIHILQKELHKCFLS